NLRDLRLELDFWLNRLDPVISIYRGNVDKNFWNMVIFDVPYLSGMPTPCWNGWISTLFPYKNSGGKILENAIIPSQIPSGLVYVPFKMFVGASEFKLKFAAGFLSARQDKIDEEYIISPAIGWYAVD